MQKNETYFLLQTDFFIQEKLFDLLREFILNSKIEMDYSLRLIRFDNERNEIILDTPFAPWQNQSNYSIVLSFISKGYILINLNDLENFINP